MSQFLFDLYQCSINFGQFIGVFSSSFWVYPVVFLFFVAILFFLISDNK